MTREDFNTGLTTDALPDDWGVQVTLSFQVDEAGSLNPSASFITSPTFVVGAGASLSSQATRVDKYEFYYAVMHSESGGVVYGLQDNTLQADKIVLVVGGKP